MIGLAFGAVKGFLAPWLRLIPVWAWVVAAALAWGAWQRHNATTSTRQAEQARANAELQAAAAEGERKARALEQTYTTNARSAADAYLKNLQSARASAGRARTSLDGLRDAIASAPVSCPAGQASSASRGLDGGAELRSVLGSCAASIRQLAEAADEDAAKLKALQDHLIAIGVANPASSPTKEQ